MTYMQVFYGTQGLQGEKGKEKCNLIAITQKDYV